MTLPVIEDEKSPWYAGGRQFTCTQCGNCCTGGPGYVWISPIEIERLANFLKLSVRETLSRYCRKEGNRVSLKEYRNSRGQYDCTFLKEIDATREVEGQTVRYRKRICEAYDVRPLQCRTWPFWKELLSSEKSWELATNKCPGMNTGRKWSLDEIEKIRTSLDWPDRPPSSS